MWNAIDKLANIALMHLENRENIGHEAGIPTEVISKETKSKTKKVLDAIHTNDDDTYVPPYDRDITDGCPPRE